MSDIALAEKYVSALKSLGFSPEIDDEGDVKFMYEGSRYYIRINENDPEFFSIFYLIGLEDEDDEEYRAKAIEASIETSKIVKFTKVFVQTNSLLVLFESMIVNLDDIPKYFNRCLHVIQRSVNEFGNQMDNLD